MKLNHLFIAALALGLTHSFVLAGEGENNQVSGRSGGGESKGNYLTTTKATAGPTREAPAGTARVSTRGSVTTAAVISTARPTATRTASLSRVNLRRPTATSTTPTAPVGGGQSNGL